MKQKNLLIALLILHFTFLIRLAAEDTWVQTYQPFGDEVSYFVEDIRVCPDEGYAVIGSVWNSEFSTNNGFMMKTDSDGNMLWASIDTVDFVTGPEPSGFVVLDDGSFITLGNNFWGVGRYLLKRNPTGIIDWTVELDNDYGTEAIELTNDGKMVTTGGSMDGAISLQKFDLNGDLIWRETYLPDGFEYGSGYSITQTSDGGYALTGKVHGTNNNDIIVIKTDEIGNSLWSWTYNGTQNYRDVGNCIIENSDSELLIGGYINETNNRDYYGFLTKMNTLGDTIWTRKFDANNETSNIWSLLQHENDYYILRSTKIIIIDESQNVIWDSVNDWGLTFGYASGDRSIQKLQNNQYICCGEKNINGSSIIVSKTDSTGNVVSVEDYEIFQTKNNNINCYPNPFNPYIHFEIRELDLFNCRIEIFNIKGQKIESLPIENKNMIWNASNYSSGLYLVNLMKNSTIIQTKKITLIK